ncbi:MAG TPA: alpha/beta hydrolase [Candidatus Polarisedimenticolia bacterium]|nr:alpha/beta hydrolase [Candidatus Polarisedimenticolia bacterium]
MPATPDPEARYVIYLHGRIIEDSGPRPVHPRFGVYEYEPILEQLAAQGLQVISEIRPAGTDIRQYAARVVEQMKRLHAAGVPMERITTVGFSKGGGIALLASSLLDRPDARFVLLAICGDSPDDDPGLRMRGRVLSIYEASDELGSSCRRLFERSPADLEYDEIRIDTGEGHGAFYRPRPEWLTPLVAWILDRDTPPRGTGG